MKPASAAETKRVWRRAIHDRKFLESVAEYVKQNPELLKD